jgi:hypothetical protein
VTAFPRVLDQSAIVALFAADRGLDELVAAAQAGRATLLLPTTAMADAEAQLGASTRGWEAVLLTDGISSLPLSEHAAIEIGRWPGDLSTRQAVHEARALRATVVTTEPGRYRGLPVTLTVV